ncbi:hypothetical protein U9M48_036647 [Paspalum notatum var. saurae]|uniref:Translation initiation factor 5A C-terminal domain-containing protein n=1 Tax=Paspalum notatum var. saurae TaxID=547442 RepID=A0AAQ3UFL4_PASNO
MWDSEEHHFESKADAGASKTYPQQGRNYPQERLPRHQEPPLQVTLFSATSKVLNTFSLSWRFQPLKLGSMVMPSATLLLLTSLISRSLKILSHLHTTVMSVPHVNRTEYQLIDISEDGFVSLLTENGNTKDDLRLPTDDNLLTQIKDGFAEGKDLVVTVMSAMGE